MNDFGLHGSTTKVLEVYILHTRYLFSLCYAGASEFNFHRQAHAFIFLITTNEKQKIVNGPSIYNLGCQIGSNYTLEVIPITYLFLCYD